MAGANHIPLDTQVTDTERKNLNRVEPRAELPLNWIQQIHCRDDDSHSVRNWIYAPHVRSHTHHMLQHAPRLARAREPQQCREE